MAVRGPYYSKRQLEGFWIEEGGDPAKADVASAIALAESSGGAGSYSSNPASGLTNYGLYQLARSSAGDLFDPRANTRAAIAQSSNGTNWCDWQTWDGRGCRAGPYTSAYKAHLDGAAPPASSGQPPGAGTLNAHAGAPLPEPANAGERDWDPAPKIRAAATARTGHAHVLETAARNVTTKLARWRLPG